ncbi:MAG: carboxylesterase family protein [Chitinophagaceae bacterium]|nr:carboxylesterase family protein [Chitinophagaceae bacterium]
MSFLPKKYLFALLLVLLSRPHAQGQVLPYTNPVYAVRMDSAVTYGTSLNYCNAPFTLKMNIYKPIGDNNTQRPVIIFVHGGAFTSADDFNEYHMNVLAREFAKRGYVAASLDYREGHHLFPYGIGSPSPIGIGALLNWDDGARLFVSDSAEVIRSLFRAQQDVKGAIRFMKQNHAADSTAPCKVFIAGHSAGGITVLAAAYTDQTSEKSTLSGAIANAPNPNWTSGGFDFFGTWVVTQVNGPQDRDDLAYRTHNPVPFNYELPACYVRPDLGTVYGSENLSGVYDASVIGVAAMCGAVGDTNIFSGNSIPALYMYHVPVDVVVPYHSGYPFTYTADLITPAPFGKWPVLYGSHWIEQKLLRTGYPAAFHLQTYDNGGNLTNSHDLLPNDFVVADSIALFFAKVLDTSTACSRVILPAGIVFDARKQDNTGIIHWNTSGGMNRVNLFSVQRAGVSGLFTDAGPEIPFANGQDDYIYYDRQPLQGVNRYRLKIIYADNHIEFSDVRSLVFNRIESVLLYPDPADQQVILTLPDSWTGNKVKLVIFDMSGKAVLKKEWAAGGNPLILSTDQFKPGTYILRLQHKTDRPVSEKLVIQHH